MRTHLEPNAIWMMVENPAQNVIVLNSLRRLATSDAEMHSALESNFEVKSDEKIDIRTC